ncbi:unnamed protein product [Cyclocybe aegerita]|uniref:HNH nuclease domain-containing protein n=1 Tax=Cyclocybe aegerita TaxID=1973307 RepID=A0A8S0VUM5_CYCAE|nr:unnamed protein product [Cyclocybe aegerita]
MSTTTSQAESTPESRILVDTGLSKAAKFRVDSVDPNHARCLVENCPPERAVNYCHLVPRRVSWKEEDFMDSVEWYWNLRRGSLNLDTRRNIFRAGSSLHWLHDQHQWALLPPPDIVDIYAHSLIDAPAAIRLADRKAFPTVPDGIYEYRLIPLRDMQNVGISRQSTDNPPTPNSFTNYVYPFNEMPPLRSHIHPKFAILEFGRKLKKMSTAALVNALRHTPALADIYVIYEAWTRGVPSEDEDAESYKPAPSDDDDQDMDPDFDGASIQTPAGRVQRTRSTRKRPAPDDPPSSSPLQRSRQLARLSLETLVDHDRDVGKGGWTKESLANWVATCAAEVEEVLNTQPSQV